MAAPSFNTQEIIDRLMARVPVVSPGFRVYEHRQRNVRDEFGKRFNCAYLMRENSIKVSDGGASRPVVRQIHDCWLEIVIVAQKFVDGENSQLVPLRTLVDAIHDSLMGFLPTGHFTALDLANSSDGDPADIVNYHAQRWHSRVLHQGVVA